MLDLGYLNLQIQPDFDLKASEDVPERLIIQLDVAQRESHQMLAIDRDFKVWFWEGKRQLERLIQDEWKFLRMDFCIAPAGTEIKTKLTIGNSHVQFKLTHRHRALYW